MAEEPMSQNPPEPAKTAVNPPAEQDPKTTEHWHTIANKKDEEIRQLKLKLEEKNKTDEVDELRKKVAEIEKTEETKRLETEYPDIEPELLLDKTTEEQKQIVERQRTRTKEFAAKSIDINTPQHTQDDLNKQIEDIKKSNKTPIEQAQEIFRLSRLKREI